MGSDPADLDDGRLPPPAPTADEEHNGDHCHAHRKADGERLGAGGLRLVADLAGELPELGFDLVTGDAVARHGHRASFCRPDRAWPRTMAQTAAAATTTT